VLPFGLCDATTTFQRAILRIFYDLINEGLEVYMDNFTPYGTDFDQDLRNMEKILGRCIATILCLSHDKCHMMMTEGVVLGNYVSTDEIKLDRAKIEVILNMPTHRKQTKVRSFLGYAGYYCIFIEHFLGIVAPLHALTGNVEFQWSDKCDVAFVELKSLVSTTPMLRGPNWKLPFHISSYASDITIGVMLG
jgi:hypothetical protein